MSVVDSALIYLDYIPDPASIVRALLDPMGFEESRHPSEYRNAD